ncbi:hypothetical protein ADEAN_000295200 [Angomonas deanei]|uniref:Uncharacterized protein n=1 Tax=Angomonas deanei TaxID=59799 RepID=A0A7G2C9F3_9TRYP|nr:hypothetical protein ADEAN_000295200 [Angomonas deanei]
MPASTNGVSKSHSMLASVEKAWTALSERFETITCSNVEEWSAEEVTNTLSEVRRLLRQILDGLCVERESFDWVVELGSGQRRLPPSYFYLFAPRHEEEEEDGEVSEAYSSTVAVEPIGEVFLFSLCQFAKQNSPAGLGEVILTFFADMLTEADIPYLRPTPAPYPGTLFHLLPSASVVPVMDMLQCIARQLDPKISVSVFHKETNTFSAGLSETSLEALDKEKVAYCRLVCAIAEAIERSPDLAGFFVTESAERGGHGPAGVGNLTNERLVVVDVLLPFLLYVSQPVSQRQRESYQYALNGILSIAKCADRWVQSFVANEAKILSGTFYSARMILVTLCKVPFINNERELLLLCLVDIMAFFNFVYVNLPSLTKAWKLRYAFQKEFVFDALIPLLRILDPSVFGRACLVTCELVKGAKGLSEVISKAILATPVVSHYGGKLCLCYGDILQCADKHPNGAEGGPDMSFFNFFIARRIREYPVSQTGVISYGNSDEQVVWRLAESALSLTKTLIVYTPDTFLKYALLGSAERSQTKCGVDAFPTFNLDLCFPTKIVLESNDFFEKCRYNIATESLAKLLFIESNAGRTTRRHRRQSTSDEEPSASSVSDSRRNKHLFSPAVQEAPVVLALCKLFASGVHLPVPLFLQVTDVIASLCLLPDARVVCTLMDREYGRLDHALTRLSSIIDEEFERDEDAMFAAAAAAAKVAGENKKRVNAKSLKAASADTQESSVAGVSERRLKAVSLINDVVGTTSTVFTRDYLYRQLASLFLVSGRLTLGSEDTKQLQRVASSAGLNEEVVTAIQLHRQFLELCLCLELFRYEIDSIISHTTFSAKLYNLQRC